MSEKKPKKKRCLICNKKYGLIPFECTCGGQFCINHRYTDAHNCPFDYKSLERDRLRQNNPVIIQDKVTDRI